MVTGSRLTWPDVAGAKVETLHTGCLVTLIAGACWAVLKVEKCFRQQVVMNYKNIDSETVGENNKTVLVCQKPIGLPLNIKFISDTEAVANTNK